jgi:hypothetical protein
MRTKPHVLSTRVSTKTRAHLYKLAREFKQPVAAIIAGAIDAIAQKDYEAAGVLVGLGQNASPQRVLAQIVALLGLKDDASPEAISAAFDDLLIQLMPPGGADSGGTGEGADAPPPATLTRLNATELAYCKREKISPAAFLERKRGAARRLNTRRSHP